MKSVHWPSKNRSVICDKLPELIKSAKKKHKTPRSVRISPKQSPLRRNCSVRLNKDNSNIRKQRNSHSSTDIEKTSWSFNISVLKSSVAVEKVLEDMLLQIGKSSNLSKFKTNFIKEIEYFKIFSTFKDIKKLATKRAVILEIIGVFIIEEFAKIHEFDLFKTQNIGMIIYQNHLEIIDIFIKTHFKDPDKYIISVQSLIDKKRINVSSLRKNCDILTKNIKQMLSKSSHALPIEYILSNMKVIHIPLVISLLLGQAKIQYLPEKTHKSPYTLILDLDETLVHYRNSFPRLLIRPFCSEFIKEASKWFELVLYTEYADWVLKEIDSSYLINHRLYRQHTVLSGQFRVKDLRRIGRNLKSVIIIDNLAESFQKQPENGILIKNWEGDTDDTALRDLLPVLVKLAKSKVNDVRKKLAEFKGIMIQEIMNGNSKPHLALV